MNRDQHNRKIIRENGSYALKWLAGTEKADMLKLQTIRRTPDELSERADMVKWCKLNKISFNLKNWIDSKNWSIEQ